MTPAPIEQYLPALRDIFKRMSSEAYTMMFLLEQPVTSVTRSMSESAFLVACNEVLKLATTSSGGQS